MYHSITFGDMNTFDEWHLFSPIIPIVAPPSPKTRYVDILGRSGSLDYTEALTKIPTYSDREGSWEFIILNPGDVDQYTIEDEESYRYDFDDLYSDILLKLHGKHFDRIVLEDDPDYAYQGRVWISNAQRSKDWNSITINYKLNPFKYGFNSAQRRTVSISKTTIAYSDRVTVPLELPAGSLPTPLIVRASSSENEAFIQFNLKNPELQINSWDGLNKNVLWEGSNFDTDVAINGMMVSNATGSNTCELIVGPQLEVGTNVGPVTLQYWWEEAVL